MDTLNRTKYKQAILYFASTIPLDEQSMVKLYKLLYFLDFDHFRKNGESITGETYRKLPMGPGPSHCSQVVDEMEKEGLLKQKAIRVGPAYKDRKTLEVCAEPDLSVFSDEERESLECVTREHSPRTGKELANLSHNDPPCLLAEDGGILDYEDTWYRYNPELDEGPDPIAEALAEINIAQLIEDKFHKKKPK